MEAKKRKKAPRTCEGCSRWKEVKRRIRISEALETSIQELEARLKSKELKPTMGDYLKLLQMEQEFQQDAPKEITVTWVEQPKESSEK